MLARRQVVLCTAGGGFVNREAPFPISCAVDAQDRQFRDFTCMVAKWVFHVPTTYLGI